jgi:hypothetical protein
MTKWSNYFGAATDRLSGMRLNSAWSIGTLAPILAAT